LAVPNGQLFSYLPSLLFQYLLHVLLLVNKFQHFPRFGLIALQKQVFGGIVGKDKDEQDGLDENDSLRHSKDEVPERLAS
jgi:hypothetical protein